MTSLIVIYRALFPNGKAYVGQTRRTLATRKAEHYCNARHGRHGNPIFNRALLKYGDAVKWEVISSIPPLLADEEERAQIAANGTLFPRGYNFRPGGHHTSALKGRKKPPRTAAHIANHRASLLGRTHSKATRDKMSATHKARGTLPPWRKARRAGGKQR